MIGKTIEEAKAIIIPALGITEYDFNEIKWETDENGLITSWAL